MGVGGLEAVGGAPRARRGSRRRGSRAGRTRCAAGPAPAWTKNSSSPSASRRNSGRPSLVAVPGDRHLVVAEQERGPEVVPPGRAGGCRRRGGRPGPRPSIQSVGAWQPVEVAGRAEEPGAAVLLLHRARRQADVGLPARDPSHPLRHAVHALEVASPGLGSLDGLEEGLEVALAEAGGALALDDLEEHGRAGR